jgi:hypothetical protein
MIANPELKVLDSVVELVAVLVMDGFVTLEAAAKRLLHDEAVLHNHPPTGHETSVAVNGDIARSPLCDLEYKWITVLTPTRVMLLAIAMAADAPSRLRLSLRRVVTAFHCAELATKCWTRCHPIPPQ